MNFVLIQIIGAFGYSILALSYYGKEKSRILFMQIISYVFFSIHYFLLSGITGALCNFMWLIALVTIYLLDKYNVKNKRVYELLMVPIIVIVAMFTFKDIYSVFPIVASALAVISFTTDKENTIRAIGVIAAICWLIYSIVYHSYVAIVFEIVTLAVVAFAFIKSMVQRKRG